MSEVDTLANIENAIVQLECREAWMQNVVTVLKAHDQVASVAEKKLSQFREMSKAYKHRREELEKSLKSKGPS